MATKNEVRFAQVASREELEAVVDHTSNLIGFAGPAMEVLMGVVRDMIPVLPSGNDTAKTIIYVQQCDCPCCDSTVYAIVMVGAGGVYHDDEDHNTSLDQDIMGLWQVRLGIPYEDDLPHTAQAVVDRLVPIRHATEAINNVPRRHGNRWLTLDGKGEHRWQTM